MLQTIMKILLWLSVIGCGVIGGVYFAFSTFIMKALGSAGGGAGLPAMQAINQTILTSPFMPLFFGTTLLSLALGIIAVVHWNTGPSSIVLLSSVIYFAGMFIVTVVFNVPLNDGLAVQSMVTGNDTWRVYQSEWTFWNHVRTGASLVASGLYLHALRSFAAAVN